VVRDQFYGQARVEPFVEAKNKNNFNLTHYPTLVSLGISIGHYLARSVTKYSAIVFMQSVSDHLEQLPKFEIGTLPADTKSSTTLSL
jgi:hypothetical protein